MRARLDAARRVVDQAWPIYDGSPSEEVSRSALVGRARVEAFPHHGMALNQGDVQELATAIVAAHRNQLALTHLQREDEVRHAERRTPASELTAFGSRVAASQADDWLRLLRWLHASTRRYEIVDGPEVGPPSRLRAVQRFARRCAAELGIRTPDLGWIRPVNRGGDLVTLGDIAGCASNHDGTAIFVRTDISSDRDRFRVVAHEVAHHGGADEQAARAYELTAVRRHGVVDGETFALAPLADQLASSTSQTSQTSQG
jgi:hypothetical protein